MISRFISLCLQHDVYDIIELVTDIKGVDLTVRHDPCYNSVQKVVQDLAWAITDDASDVIKKTFINREREGIDYNVDIGVVMSINSIWMAVESGTRVEASAVSSGVSSAMKGIK